MTIINRTSVWPLQQKVSNKCKKLPPQTWLSIASAYTWTRSLQTSNWETSCDWGSLEGASQEVSHLILVHSSQKLQPRAFWSSLYGIQCFTLSTSMRFISQTSNNSCKIIHLQLTWKINKCQWHSSNVFFKHAIPNYQTHVCWYDGPFIDSNVYVASTKI